jgi:K(+)-stimulated pyrophosphate-energized sodium pump
MATVGLILALLCAVGALIYGVQSVKWILAKDAGNARMQEIAAAVQEGARAYLNRQYTTIAIVGVVVGAIIWFAPGHTVRHRLRDRRGLLGRGRLYRHVRFGARQCSHRSSRSRRLERGAGSGVSRRRDHRPAGGRPRPARRDRLLCSAVRLQLALFPILARWSGLAFGSSLISIFARLGGGIFTKGADVGADLVGKVEAGIPKTIRAIRR